MGCKWAVAESSMTKTENADTGSAAKDAGCCGGGHDHSGHAHPAHHADGRAAGPEGTIYTCPMHPRIRQLGPGSCPICGMALEPEVASLDAPPNPELADMTRRFWIGLVLSLPAVVLEMGGHLAGGYSRIHQRLSNWIPLGCAPPCRVLACAAVFWPRWRAAVVRH